jgi:hypothetical protein
MSRSGLEAPPLAVSEDIVATIEYLVRGSGSMMVRYSALKGGTVEAVVRLR